jgi:hypothetical protein
LFLLNVLAFLPLNIFFIISLLSTSTSSFLSAYEYRNVFTVTGSSIGRMMDRQNSEFKIGYQGNGVYPVGVVYTADGYDPDLSVYYPPSAEDKQPEAAGKFCITLLYARGAHNHAAWYMPVPDNDLPSARIHSQTTHDEIKLQGGSSGSS